jgi:hypothetical protein
VTIGDNQGFGTITNDDVARTITVGNMFIVEGNAGVSQMVFTATLSQAAPVDLTFSFQTANDTALAGSDYNSENGLATFLAGQTQTTFDIDILGDAIIEPDENFFVNLSITNVTNVTIPDNQVVGTITNDDFQAVPTLDEYALILLVIALSAFAVRKMTS